MVSILPNYVTSKREAESSAYISLIPKPMEFLHYVASSIGKTDAQKVTDAHQPN